MSISTGVAVAGNSHQAVLSKAQGTVPKPAEAAVNAVLVPGTVTAARDAVPEKPGAEQVRQSLEDINKVMVGFSISVQFQIDPDYKELIVRVVDQDTGKLIRQIPTEEVVSMSKAMDNLKGLLFAQSV